MRTAVRGRAVRRPERQNREILFCRTLIYLFFSFDLLQFLKPILCSVCTFVLQLIKAVFTGDVNVSAGVKSGCKHGEVCVHN